MTFHVGQWVECVRADFEWHPRVPFWFRWFHRGRDPVRGKRYVVAACKLRRGEIVLALVGFDPCVSYQAHAFRPIVETEFERLVEIAAKPPKKLVRALQPDGIL